jgi:hypothetical protein
VHSQKTGSLFYREPTFRICFDMEVGDASTLLIEKKLLACDRRLGVAHGMHLSTSADHSHLYLSVRIFETPRKCLG